MNLIVALAPPRLPSAKIRAGGGISSTNHVSKVYSPAVNINAQGSGNRETDAALAEKINDELKTMLNNQMVEFVAKQQRPGSMMNKKRFV